MFLIFLLNDTMCNILVMGPGLFIEKNKPYLYYFT